MNYFVLAHKKTRNETPNKNNNKNAKNEKVIFGAS
jgi:hypothetical protein